MQSVERIAFVILISAILAVVTATLLMLICMGGQPAGACEGAVLIWSGLGGAA